MRATKKNLRVGMVLERKPWWTGFKREFIMILSIIKNDSGYDLISALRSPYPNHFWLPLLPGSTTSFEFKSEGYYFLKSPHRILTEKELRSHRLKNRM